MTFVYCLIYVFVCLFVSAYLTSPGSEENGAMPALQRPLLEQINNELAAEISQVLIHEEHLGLGKVLGQGGCGLAEGKIQYGFTWQLVKYEYYHHF